MQDRNLIVSNMVTGMNVNSIVENNSNQQWNNGKCWCECKNSKNMCAKKLYLESCNMYM